MIMIYVAALIIGFIIFVFYLAITPVTLNFSYDTAKKHTRGWVKIFPFEYKFFTLKKKLKAEIPEAKKKEKRHIFKKRTKSTEKKYSIWKVLSDEFDTAFILISNVFVFINRIVKSRDSCFLHLSLRGGLPSPDLTGQLYGFVTALKPMMNKSVSVIYEPDFIGDSIKADILAGIKFRIYKLLKEMLIFTWKLPKLRIIKIFRKLRGGYYAKQT